MIPQEPERHDKAADAVHQGRPVDAELVRSGRKGPRILVLLVVSTLAAAVLLLGLWMVSNGGFNAQNPTPSEQATDAQAFTGDSQTPPAADAPTDSTGEPAPIPTRETPNVNAPTVPSN
jgi:cytoskeletal protein RodZ